jgi:hypothetical protein
MKLLLLGYKQFTKYKSTFGDIDLSQIYDMVYRGEHRFVMGIRGGWAPVAVGHPRRLGGDQDWGGTDTDRNGRGLAPDLPRRPDILKRLRLRFQRRPA